MKKEAKLWLSAWDFFFLPHGRPTLVMSSVGEGPSVTANPVMKANSRGALIAVTVVSSLMFIGAGIGNGGAGREPKPISLSLSLSILLCVYLHSSPSRF